MPAANAMIMLLPTGLWCAGFENILRQREYTLSAIPNFHPRKWDADHTCLMIMANLNVQSLFIITFTSARDSGTQVLHSSCHC
jgi:hypothetical protein